MEPETTTPDVLTCLRIVGLLLEALQSIHKTWIHGDISLDNLFVDGDLHLARPRGVFLLDFGSARPLDASGKTALIHTEDALYTTNVFSAPEINDFRQNGTPLQLTAAADVYSVGRLLRLLLNSEALCAIREGNAISLTLQMTDTNLCELDVDRSARPFLNELNGILRAAAEKDPAQRISVNDKLSSQMKNVRSSVFGQLNAIAAELDAAPDAGSSQSVVDRSAILAHYEQQSDSYPNDYTGDANFRTLISVLDLIKQGQQDAAEQTISSAIANLDAVRGRTASHRRLYADIRTDLAALQISLTSHGSTDTAVIRESISTLRSQMMQQTEDSDLITASCDDLIAAALRAGLNADYANLSELRSNAVEYIQLLSLSTSINDRTAQQPHLAQQIAQASALPDEEEVWQQIRTVYRSVFNGLRAELAASPLDGKADLLAKIDTTTKKYLSSQTLLSKFFVVANPMNAGLSASFPAWISILLALALDLSATAAAAAAANIRRHSSERMLTFTDAEQAPAA